MHYRITNDGAAVLTDGFGFTSFRLRDGANDAAAAGTIMRRYFDGCYDLLIRQLERLRDVDRPLTEQEKRELAFLLKALIKEKDVMYGKDR
jgi:hypothetical protein